MHQYYGVLTNFFEPCTELLYRAQKISGNAIVLLATEFLYRANKISEYPIVLVTTKSVFLLRKLALECRHQHALLRSRGVQNGLMRGVLKFSAILPAKLS